MLAVAYRPASAAAPTAEALTDDHVQRAIDALVVDLYARKDPKRFWNPETIPSGESARQEGGYTALAVLALLYAGESYQDPRLRDAVRFLEEFEMRGTYAVAVRALVWGKLSDRFLPRLEADARWLAESFGARTGCWDYVGNPQMAVYDNSLRQYGALALWEAAKRGVNVEESCWRTLEEKLLEVQMEDGGWNYRPDRPASGSMTTAGLATLFITQDMLRATDAVRLRATANAGPAETAMARGLEWLDRNFTADDNPGIFREYDYYLHGVERVGLASGRKHIGGHDWFRECAAQLLSKLFSWDDAGLVPTVRDPGNRSSATITRVHCFALLFLSRGRVPVAFNKLAVAGMRWNNRPRDVANLARHVTYASETDLNWQVVDAHAPPETWLDAPILYLASHEALPEDEALHAALREYLELGGLLLAVNDGEAHNLARSIEALGTRLFPGATWRDLPEEHWAYRINERLADARPRLRGLSNGVRELIVLAADGDLAAAFQAPSDAVSAPLALGANLYLYASERNRPRPRLAAHAAREVARSGGRAVTIVRASYAGNWNPEPAALEVFRRRAVADFGLAVTVSDAPLAGVDRIQPRPDLVIVSGIDAVAFSPEELDAIAQYVARGGGLILFETAGGLGSFATAAEAALVERFGEAPRNLLREPILEGTGIEGATDVRRVEYRPFSQELFGGRETAARVRGIVIDGAPRILFSREDLSHALLDQPRWGVSGYAPASARRLLANVVLYGRAGRATAN